MSEEQLKQKEQAEVEQTTAQQETEHEGTERRIVLPEYGVRYDPDTELLVLLPPLY